MNPETILQIIKLSLEITLEIIRGVPLDAREKMWRDHIARMEWWDNLLRKLMAVEAEKKAGSARPRKIQA